jgi:spermidine/putrescine transport system ATP-binding protein
VLLLDEPLGALDLKLRKALQYELAALQAELDMTFIYVTHDQEEAMTMADRIAVMHNGRVLQIGSPEEIYETPTTQFVADFIGETNFVRGKLTERGDPFGVVMVDDVPVKAVVASPELAVGSTVTVAIRPEKINLFDVAGVVKYADGTSESSQEHKAMLLRDADINLTQGVVKHANYIGTDTRYIVSLGHQELVARVQNFGLRSDSFFEVGEQVNIFWDAENARVLGE